MQITIKSTLFKKVILKIYLEDLTSLPNKTYLLNCVTQITLLNQIKLKSASFSQLGVIT